MKKLLWIALIVIVLGVGWYLVSPLFIQTTVNEDLPFSNVTTEEHLEMQEMADAINMDLPDLETLQAMTEEEAADLEADLVEHMEDMVVEVMNEEMEVSDPVALSHGTFVDADGAHKGSGDATVYEHNNERLLRLENFTVTNGPDLRVLLAEHPAPSSRADVQQGYIELGKLKGSQGNQNYEISADVDLSQYRSVVIYCKPFHVIFSTATLQ